MWKYLDELNCGERFSFKLRQARLGVAAGGHYRGERQGGRLEHGSVGTHLLEQRPASSACRYSVSMFSMLSGGISLVHIFFGQTLAQLFFTRRYSNNLAKFDKHAGFFEHLLFEVWPLPSDPWPIHFLFEMETLTFSISCGFSI